MTFSSSTTGCTHSATGVKTRRSERVRLHKRGRAHRAADRAARVLPFRPFLREPYLCAVHAELLLVYMAVLSMVSEAASVTESNRDRIIALTEQPHGSSWQLDVASWQIEHCVPPPAADIPRSRIASASIGKPARPSMKVVSCQERTFAEVFSDASLAQIFEAAPCILDVTGHRPAVPLRIRTCTCAISSENVQENAAEERRDARHRTGGGASGVQHLRSTTSRRPYCHCRRQRRRA